LNSYNKAYKEKYFSLVVLRFNARRVFKMRTEPDSKFIKVRCVKCKNEQVIFGKTSSKVNCLVCGKDMAEPTGGKTKVKARILEVLE
jgi:small subunit ribosomal protein S27e